MSHQPKAISNSSTAAKPKNNDSQITNSNNNREINQNQTILNNKQTKRNTININNNNNKNLFGSLSHKKLNFLTFFDKKYSEEENAFLINSVYTFGSNEMGQIGCDFDLKDLNSFSSAPIHLTELNNKRIISISAGDGHSVCVGKEGTVFAWGASACGNYFCFYY